MHDTFQYMASIEPRGDIVSFSYKVGIVSKEKKKKNGRH